LVVRLLDEELSAELLMCVVITVAMIPPSANCDSGVAVSGQVGFLTSVRQSSRSPPASLHCRWNITVAAGRTVNLTLYDFGVFSRHSRPRTDADNRRQSR